MSAEDPRHSKLAAVAASVVARAKGRAGAPSKRGGIYGNFDRENIQSPVRAAGSFFAGLNPFKKMGPGATPVAGATAAASASASERDGGGGGDDGGEVAEEAAPDTELDGGGGGDAAAPVPTLIRGSAALLAPPPQRPSWWWWT